VAHVPELVGATAVLDRAAAQSNSKFGSEEKTMPSCYVCGVGIPHGEGHRRVVWTGRSRGTSIGRGIRGYSSNHYGPRTVCEDCAQEIDEAEAFRNRVNAIIVMVVLVVIVIFLFVRRLR
jgi:predicted nucleic acid-binding Zn ribbon protein